MLIVSPFGLFLTTRENRQVVVRSPVKGDLVQLGMFSGVPLEIEHEGSAYLTRDRERHVEHGIWLTARPPDHVRLVLGGHQQSFDGRPGEAAPRLPRALHGGLAHHP
jgi:hypothetical protein